MPLLWLHEFEGLHQFFFPLENKIPQIVNLKAENKRLGKLAEDLFSVWIENNNEWKLLFNNLQIFDQKNTIGELDTCLQNVNTKKYYHIELVTKFYLYNPNYHHDDIKAWIGPNRNDSLFQKIEKLKNKQLPLLFNPLTKEVLKKYKIPINQIEQKVCFKAQLFIPANFNKKLNTFNHNCISGFYMDFEKFISNYKTSHKYYIPNKQDWLRLPETQTAWLSLHLIIDKIQLFMEANQSVMVWTKNNKSYERIIITPYSKF